MGANLVAIASCGRLFERELEPPLDVVDPSLHFRLVIRLVQTKMDVNLGSVDSAFIRHMVRRFIGMNVLLNGLRDVHEIGGFQKGLVFRVAGSSQDQLRSVQRRMDFFMNGFE